MLLYSDNKEKGSVPFYIFMTIEQTPLLQRYQQVKGHIAKLDPAGKVRLLAVSKTKPIEDVLALAENGQLDFGENYLQEALAKIEQAPSLCWHFIGPIQSNKTKPIAEHFSWVHSVDRLKIAQRLSQQRPANLPPLNILLAVNIDAEASKSGLAVDEVLATAEQVAELPNITLRGLMAIPKKSDSLAAQRKPFKALKDLLTLCQTALPNQTLDTLSMGMSGDLEAAIDEGATIVRIGTDIFGART